MRTKNHRRLQRRKWERAKEAREREEDLGYQPPLPFPQCFQKKKDDEGFVKFVEMLRRIHINIPFADAISQIPSYANFLNEILTKKRRIDEVDCIPLSGECNSILQGKLPDKRRDKRIFSIPCKVGDSDEMNALCDIGSSINLMPYPVFKKLGLMEVVQTRMSLQFADK